MTKTLCPRTNPVQNRARKQRDKIMATTAELLKTVGLDDLTTILVAKKVGISVGTLYHYFPNKHAILYALSERWVEKVNSAVSELESQQLENMALKPFVTNLVDGFSVVYGDNQSSLPLVAVMPVALELQEIYSDFLSTVHLRLSGIFLRLPLSLSQDDAVHLAKFFWQICHSVLLSIYCSDHNEQQSLADLKFLSMSLLERARVNF